MTDRYPRGAVIKGPDILAEHDYRPYVQLSDDTRPFIKPTVDEIAEAAAGYLGV